MRKFTFVAIFLLTISRFAPAQTFSFQSDRVPMVELAGHFRFHTGEDPDGKLGWANPGFEDSGWQLLRSDKDWFDQGYRNYGGMAWYRFTVTAPAQHIPLALFVPKISESYQIFVNGQLIGQNGGMPPQPKVVVAHNLVYPIPDSALIPGQPLIFAIRVWHWPRVAIYMGGGPRSAMRIGEVSAIRAWKTAEDKQVFWQGSSINFLLLDRRGQASLLARFFD